MHLRPFLLSKKRSTEKNCYFETLKHAICLSVLSVTVSFIISFDESCLNLHLDCAITSLYDLTA